MSVLCVTVNRRHTVAGGQAAREEKRGKARNAAGARLRPTDGERNPPPTTQPKRQQCDVLRYFSHTPFGGAAQALYLALAGAAAAGAAVVLAGAAVVLAAAAAAAVGPKNFSFSFLVWKRP
jgi:hypothetical protein